MVFDALSVLVRGDGVRLVPLTVAPAWEPNLQQPLLDLDALRSLVGLVGRGESGFDAGVDLEALRRAGLLVEAAPSPQRPAGARAALRPGPVGEPGEGPGLDELAGAQLVLRTPFVAQVDATGFAVVDHFGTTTAHLTPEALLAAGAFGAPRTVDDARAAHHEQLGAAALDDAAFDRLVAHLARVGLLTAFDPDTESVTFLERELRKSMRAAGALRMETVARNRAYDEGAGDDDRSRVKVVGVQVAGSTPPLSTGMILAHARAWDGGRLEADYDLRPRWITHADDAPTGDEPAVFLFTDYLWSHEANLELSRRIKEANPRAVTVHGGPDCPSGPDDAAEYFRRHPYVDVAVRGEGEVTASELLAALAPSLRAGEADLDALAEVAGLQYRRGGQVCRTPDRPRIEDLDRVPSPYLTGVFEAFAATRQIGMAILETNRGCPYGCTFCDWGSATNSRIRRFELDRVFAELEWMARNEVPRVFVADANFGIFARDVDIARRFVELKEEHGFPNQFISNYAKNTVKHLREIVEVLASGGILTEGLLSLQSMDDPTLLAIRRSNIKLDKYEALAREFRSADLPLYVDLMMGLPGQTVASLRADLQQCVDREVNAKCHQTELLVNSPMNEPDYRREHAITTSRPPGPVEDGVLRAPAYVIETSSFTRADYQQMHLMRRFFLLSENFGVLRHVTRFVRQETGVLELDLLERMRADASRSPNDWPYLAMTALSVPSLMVPPVSWAYLLDDVRRYLVEVVGVAEGADLDTVLTVQHALLPAHGRQFPVTLELAHDLPAWHREVLAAKDGGHLHDWEHQVRRLAEHPPATMVVDDPHGLCERVVGQGTAIEAYADWELVSPVGRAASRHYR